MNSSVLTPKFVLAVALALAVAGLAGWFLVDSINTTTNGNADRASRTAVRLSQVNGCNNRQVRDGYLRFVTELSFNADRQPKRYRKLATRLRNLGRSNLSMLDCAATYSEASQGKPVRLDPVLGLCFVGLIGRDYWGLDKHGIARHEPVTEPVTLKRICKAEGTYYPAVKATQNPDAGVDYKPKPKAKRKAKR
jgi:hypothetical protein